MSVPIIYARRDDQNRSVASSALCEECRSGWESEEQGPYTGTEDLEIVDREGITCIGCGATSTLGFRITRYPRRPSLGDTEKWAEWYVHGTVADEDDDSCWGHFPTHAEAVDVVSVILSERYDRVGASA